MELRLGPHVLATDAGIVLAPIVPARSSAEPAPAVAGQVVDIGAAGPEAVTAAHAAYPGTAICVTVAGRDRAAAVVAAGAALLRTDDEPALRAAARSAPPEPATPGTAGWVVAVAVPERLIPLAGELGFGPRRLVRYLDGPRTAAEVRAAASSGAPVLIDADAQAPDESGILAAACVLAYQGAALLRTAHPAALRLALDMLAAIRGIRPPAAPRRALG